MLITRRFYHRYLEPVCTLDASSVKPESKCARHTRNPALNESLWDVQHARRTVTKTRVLWVSNTKYTATRTTHLTKTYIHDVEASSWINLDFIYYRYCFKEPKVWMSSSTCTNMGVRARKAFQEHRLIKPQPPAVAIQQCTPTQTRSDVWDKLFHHNNPTHLSSVTRILGLITVLAMILPLVRLPQLGHETKRRWGHHIQELDHITCL